MHQACVDGSPEVVQFLAERGAQVETTDDLKARELSINLIICTSVSFLCHLNPQRNGKQCICSSLAEPTDDSHPSNLHNIIGFGCIYITPRSWNTRAGHAIIILNGYVSD